MCTTTPIAYRPKKHQQQTLLRHHFIRTWVMARSYMYELICAISLFQMSRMIVNTLR